MKRAIILTAILMLLTVSAGAALEPDLIGEHTNLALAINHDPFILKAILGVLALIACVLIVKVRLDWRYRPECLPEKPKTFDEGAEIKESSILVWREDIELSGLLHRLEELNFFRTVCGVYVVGNPKNKLPGFAGIYFKKGG